MTTPGDNALQVAITGTRAGVVARFATVRQPNSVAVDPAVGTVYVTGSTSGGGLQILTPAG